METVERIEVSESAPAASHHVGASGAADLPSGRELRPRLGRQLAETWSIVRALLTGYDEV